MLSKSVNGRQAGLCGLLLSNQNQLNLNNTSLRLHHMIVHEDMMNVMRQRRGSEKSRQASLPGTRLKVSSHWESNPGQCLELPVLRSLSYDHQATTSPGFLGEM